MKLNELLSNKEPSKSTDEETQLASFEVSFLTGIQERQKALNPAAFSKAVKDQKQKAS